MDEGRRTNSVCVPLLLDIQRIPYMFGKVGRPLVHIHKLYQLGVQMRVAERTVGHEGVVEMPRVSWVLFESVEVGEFGLCKGVRVQVKN